MKAENVENVCSPPKYKLKMQGGFGQSVHLTKCAAHLANCAS